MIPVTLSVSPSPTWTLAPVCAIALVASNEAPSGSAADIQFHWRVHVTLRAFCWARAMDGLHHYRAMHRRFRKCIDSRVLGRRAHDNR